MPKSKKNTPGNSRSKKFETIFCIFEISLIVLLWIMRVYFQASTGELIAVYFVGTISAIVALRAIDRRAAERALDILGRP